MIGETLFGLNENHGEIVVEEIDTLGHYQIRENYKTLSFRKWLISKSLIILHYLLCAIQFTN